MTAHKPIMHFALSESKRLLHYRIDYALRMKSDPNERLRQSRKAAGFETAIEAADALGVPRGTYIGHENGHRGFPAKRAPQYARKFKVTEEWLLYGKGEGPRADSPDKEEIDAFLELFPNADELARMIEEAHREIVVPTQLSDWSRAVAAGVREQLVRRAEIARPEIERRVAKAISRDKGLQSLPATKRA